MRRVPQLPEGQRIHLLLASGTHCIEAVQAKSVMPDYTSYRFADYNELRSIELQNGRHKSMFDTTGIVRGSSRKERWLLWPIGVKDAGAMR